MAERGPDDEQWYHWHLLTLLSVSAAMVGVCLTAIGLVGILKSLRELEVFIVEDMNELDSARKLIGALLASGQIADANEARFLARRLEALQRRGAGPGVDRPATGLVR